MKLLGWMHRKFRQNNNETQKDFSIGNSCTCLTGFTGQSSPNDHLHCYQKQSSYSCKKLSKSQRDNHLRNSFTSVEEEHKEEEEAAAELFHGFLAIGTLGNTEPATPTFSISVDHIAEQETQVTENELKQINYELEKVLGAQGRDERCDVSSGRNSQVSSERMSYCSTITLSGGENYGNEGINCPLQSYLFGSAKDSAPAVRREQRTSLGELFQKTKQAEENSAAKMERSEKRVEKETEKSAIHVVKKMLKKRIVNGRPNSGGTMDSTTPETKLQKMLHIFKRKVHPENSSWKPITKNEVKKKTQLVATDLRPSTEDIILYPQQHHESACSCNNHSHTSGNECWVKTDADYLVLEL